MRERSREGGSRREAQTPESAGGLPCGQLQCRFAKRCPLAGGARYPFTAGGTRPPACQSVARPTSNANASPHGMPR